MKIDNKVSELLRTEQVAGTRGASTRPTVEPVAPVTRTDRVRISEAGRALAAQEAAGAEGGLSAERVSELRQRVQDGTYNSPAVADRIARRLVESGDL
jgi:anti-sigma28 factor (negative regulator of flagellin synthesis)